MAVSLPPLNGGTGHVPEEKRGTDIHKDNQRRGRLLPWLQPIPQMGPRDQGVTRGNTRYFQKQNVHFVTWLKTAGPQMPKYAFLNWCIYPNTIPPIISTLSVESAPESYSGPPLGVLDHSHRTQRHGPTLVMALMQTAFLPDVCSLPCASVTQVMQRARWLLYIISHKLSWRQANLSDFSLCVYFQFCFWCQPVITSIFHVSLYLSSICSPILCV